MTLRLKKGNPSPPFYGSLQKYFEEKDFDLTRITPADVREAVIAIRTEKLPDPSVVANNGSFFKNPIVSKAKFDDLVRKHGELPHFNAGDGQVKLAAGWLIENAGLKGYSDYGFKTYEKNALVIINTSAQTYDDLKSFRQHIVDVVMKKFSVPLEQEPEVL